MQEYQLFRFVLHSQRGVFSVHIRQSVTSWSSGDKADFQLLAGWQTPLTFVTYCTKPGYLANVHVSIQNGCTSTGLLHFLCLVLGTSCFWLVSMEIILMENYSRPACHNYYGFSFLLFEFIIYFLLFFAILVLYCSWSFISMVFLFSLLYIIVSIQWGVKCFVLDCLN